MSEDRFGDMTVREAEALAARLTKIANDVLEARRVLGGGAEPQPRLETAPAAPVQWTPEEQARREELAMLRERQNTNIETAVLAGMGRK